MRRRTRLQQHEHYFISKKWLEQVHSTFNDDQCSIQTQLPWLLVDAENDNYVILDEKKMRSRSHLTVIAQCSCIFSNFLHISKSNNKFVVASVATVVVIQWRLLPYSLVPSPYCIVPYRVIGRCESILHRHCEHLYQKKIEDSPTTTRNSGQTQINSQRIKQKITRDCSRCLWRVCCLAALLSECSKSR